MMQSSIQIVLLAFQKHFGVGSPIWILPEVCEVMGQVLVPYFVDRETEATLWMMCPKSPMSQQLNLS